MTVVGLVLQNCYDEVAAFYESVGYGGNLRAGDSVLAARHSGKLLGVVKLSEEKGVLVLRGMYVEAASQRQGVGGRLLEAAKRQIGTRECWCVPFNHLKEFYSRIGFVECAPETVPGFLAERLREYRDLGHRVIVMKRAAEHGPRPSPGTGEAKPST